MRPGVVRRLSRRGISVEELNSFTRRKNTASCRWTRHCLPNQSKWLPSQNTVGYQYTICSKFEKNGHLPSYLLGMAADPGSPQQATGRVGTGSRSVLVNAEEPVSTKLNEGPRFPGMLEQSAAQTHRWLPMNQSSCYLHQVPLSDSWPSFSGVDFWWHFY